MGAGAPPSFLLEDPDPGYDRGAVFECRYSFKGKDNLDGVNKAMDKAGDLADRVKDEYEKL